MIKLGQIDLEKLKENISKVNKTLDQYLNDKNSHKKVTKETIDFAENNSKSTDDVIADQIKLDIDKKVLADMQSEYNIMLNQAGLNIFLRKDIPDYNLKTRFDELITLYSDVETNLIVVTKMLELLDSVENNEISLAGQFYNVDEIDDSIRNKGKESKYWKLFVEAIVEVNEYNKTVVTKEKIEGILDSLPKE